MSQTKTVASWRVSPGKSFTSRQLSWDYFDESEELKYLTKKNELLETFKLN